MTHNRDCYNFLCSKNTDNNCNGERVNCQAHLYAEDAPMPTGEAGSVYSARNSSRRINS
jgi:hypothetical protein